MNGSDGDRQYDVVIIGAGIGGLVCGCLLAKAGMKVLIMEQHHSAGGYCSSFKRGSIVFDSAAHCFGGYRREGFTRRVFDELQLEKKIAISRFDPSDIVRTPGYTISYRGELKDTLREFESAFPGEGKNIADFFHFLLSPEPHAFARIRSWTFKRLLDEFFRNEHLKAVLAIPLLGNGGLPPSRMSAFIGSKMFSEFLLDGGYYPNDRMQALPDALIERFREFGGEVHFSSPIASITIKNGAATGVVAGNGQAIASRCVVSNCDARQTFLCLLPPAAVPAVFREHLETMIPSSSNFIAYLGIDPQRVSIPRAGTSLWFLSHYDLDLAYKRARENDIDGFGGHLVRVSPDRMSVLAIIPAAFRDIRYWQEHKSRFLDRFIERIEHDTLPGLRNGIIYKDAASPQTLFRYTRNYQGASYGWAGMPSQLADPDMSKPSFLGGLYLTGHWTTLGVGVSGVVYSGWETARRLLKREKYIS
jgi:phytoene dehydrogenase-like protein